jgi:hypothetical protein
VNEVPEKGRDTTGKGRASDPCPEEPPVGCSVLGPCTPESIDVWVRRLKARLCPCSQAKSRFCVFITLASVGTKAGETLRSVRAGVSGSSGEPAATSDRRERYRHAGRCGGGERSPSCGWHGVAASLDATEGMGHD